MKKKFLNHKFIIFLVVAVIVMIFTCQYKSDKKVMLGQLTTEQKLEDFRYMYDILKDNYAYFDVKKRKNGYDWILYKKQFEQQIIKTKNNYEFYCALENIIDVLKDSHTNLLNPYSFNYHRSLYNNVSNTTECDFTSWINILNNNTTIKKYCYWGEVLTEKKPGYKEFSKYYSNSFKDIKKNSNYKNFDVKVIEPNSIAYIKIRTMRSEYIEHDIKEIKNFLKKVKDYPYLIIDIMGNSGGDTRYWGKIVESLVDKEINYTCYSVFRGNDYSLKFYKDIYKNETFKSIKDIPYMKNYSPELKEDFKYYIENNIEIQPYNSINYKGKIFLLIDDHVFSSADALAQFCKRTGFATLVGGITKGDGIGTSPVLMTLPNSGLVIRFAAEMGLNSDGSSNAEYGTVPDIFVLPIDNGQNVIDETVKMIHKIDKQNNQQ
ncbi:peptidase family S41 [Clostridium tepidiprofundi DSM 19306]|uniref:Peptidase family S41 n=1 Tax=Clostridium tepidiprofundi DSM 19306 TaxID=1121338 RepID=A0A151B6C7_9CLOT|nr:S41 family peptidase [Clostridium tepidiprofundi]KYH35302.1 peptidase family S41 [Clostridium tepidiprofundi DSM 19306]